MNESHFRAVTEGVAALRAELAAARQARRDARLKDDPIATLVAREREAAVIRRILGKPEGVR